MAKGGEFKANKKDENENIQYYAGSENQLSMTRYMMVMMLVMEKRMVKIWRETEKQQMDWSKKNGLIRKLLLLTFYDH